METKGEHANSTQKGQVPTPNILSVKGNVLFTELSGDFPTYIDWSPDRL